MGLWIPWCTQQAGLSELVTSSKTWLRVYKNASRPSCAQIAAGYYYMVSACALYSSASDNDQMKPDNERRESTSGFPTSVNIQKTNNKKNPRVCSVNEFHVGFCCWRDVGFVEGPSQVDLARDQQMSFSCSSPYKETKAYTVSFISFSKPSWTWWGFVLAQLEQMIFPNWKSIAKWCNIAAMKNRIPTRRARSTAMPKRDSYLICKCVIFCFLISAYCYHYYWWRRTPI